MAKFSWIEFSELIDPPIGHEGAEVLVAHAFRAPGLATSLACPGLAERLMPDRPTKIDELEDVPLTSGQGFRAMGKFLAAYFDRTNGRGRLGRWSAMWSLRATVVLRI